MTRKTERPSTTLYMLDNTLALACWVCVGMYVCGGAIQIASWWSSNRESGCLSDGGLHLVPRGVHARLRSKSLRIGEAELAGWPCLGTSFSEMGSVLDARRDGWFLAAFAVHAVLCCAQATAWHTPLGYLAVSHVTSRSLTDSGLFFFLRNVGIGAAGLWTVAFAGDSHLAHLPRSP